VTDASTHLFWITSRAAGICALVLASLAVTAGLAMGRKGANPARLRTTHEALSLGTLAALAVHTLSLLFDSYLSPSLADLAIPFVGSYRPVWTSAGIIAAYGLAALSLSYYARARIGVARWRKLHRFIALFWLLGVVHTLGAGTDAGQIWFVVMFGLVVGPPLAMLGGRMWERSVGSKRELPRAPASPSARRLG
jgi:methionine sulfoxide reductase heme-binding subunit